MRHPNPFFYGNPVPYDHFIGRERELRHVVGRIVYQGQSTAIVGEPRVGKTSLVEYLCAQETCTDLYGAKSDRMLFSYLDGHTLPGEFTQAQFWERALTPLYEQVVKSQRLSALGKAYDLCEENAFGMFVMERLLAQMRHADRRANWHLVLLLDEFDLLLHHPVLNCAEFFGSLRGLASRSKGALALVLTSRQSISALNTATQQFSRTGSPYFNFLSEVTLGPFEDKNCADLFERADGRFTRADRRMISDWAGNHPYLLQVAASEMWEGYLDEPEDVYRRCKALGDRLYDEVAATVGDTWRLWSAPQKMAFTAVALPDLALDGRRFQERRLLRDLRDCGPELRELKKRGFVMDDRDDPDGWRVRPSAALWWLADEIVRTVRDDRTYEDWIRAQEFEGLLTRQANEKLKHALQETRKMLTDGARTLIEEAAKGAAEGMMAADH